MSRSTYIAGTVLGIVGFAVLMGLRTEPSTFAARVVIAGLAGACLGVALICLQKARSP
jgi:hypothetical protein